MSFITNLLYPESVDVDNIGNLHVWKKTTVVSEEIPAGYTIKDVTVDRSDVGDQILSGQALICLGGSKYASMETGTEITINDSGGVTLSGTTQSYVSQPTDKSLLLGKYVKLTYVYGYGPINIDNQKTYYIPSDATISYSNYWIRCDKLQVVDSYAKTPAGTYTDYVASQNRSSYKDGGDGSEQPATYELENEKNGSFVMVGSSSGGGWREFNYSSSIFVTDDGVVHLSEPINTSNAIGVGDSDYIAKAEVLKGKYVQQSTNINDYNYVTEFSDRKIFFIPSDATFSTSGNRFYVNKYQDITGYPFIPAGTTYTYLGQLGAGTTRMAVGEYIGTGLSGESNPNSITFEFEPKFVFIGKRDWPSNDNIYGIQWIYGTEIMYGTAGSYQRNYYNNRAKLANNVLSWWSTNNSATYQMNEANMVYKYIVIG